jgi:hypothetical protein
MTRRCRGGGRAGRCAPALVPGAAAADAREAGPRRLIPPPSEEPMLLTILLAVVLSAAAAGAWLGLASAMRRPALARRLMRVAPLRWGMARMTRAGLRAARRRAERDGTLPAGRPVSDLELALVVSDTEEARRARAMMARLTPRQRAELSRRTMGADGLAGLMESAAATSAADADALGRADRRRASGVAAAGAGRQAQRRKAVARRRAARKAARR